VIRKKCINMNVGNMYPLLAAMLTARPWDDIVDERLDSLSTKKGANQDAKIAGYVEQYASHIADILNRVPREMLLLFKTNDCLRHADRMLGTPINTFIITGRVCVRELAAERRRRFPGLRSFFAGLWRWLSLEVRMSLFQLAAACARRPAAVTSAVAS